MKLKMVPTMSSNLSGQLLQLMLVLLACPWSFIIITNVSGTETDDSAGIHQEHQQSAELLMQHLSDNSADNNIEASDDCPESTGHNHPHQEIETNHRKSHQKHPMDHFGEMFAELKSQIEKFISSMHHSMPHHHQHEHTTIGDTNWEHTDHGPNCKHKSDGQPDHGSWYSVTHQTLNHHHEHKGDLKSLDTTTTTTTTSTTKAPILLTTPAGVKEDLLKRRKHLEEKFHLKSPLEIIHQQEAEKTRHDSNDKKVEQVTKQAEWEMSKDLLQTIIGKTSDKDELHQQQQQEIAQNQLPVNMYDNDDTIKQLTMMLDNNKQTKSEIHIPQLQETLEKTLDQGFKATEIRPHAINPINDISRSQRVRNTLLNNANIARGLRAKEIEHMLATPQTSHPDRGTSSGSISTRSSLTEAGTESMQMQQNRTDPLLSMRRWRVASSTTSGAGAPPMAPTTVHHPQDGERAMLQPHFLGFGQLQRIDPFNGNNRTQARLSCQFGDPSAKNNTISNVEWLRFVGEYDANITEPAFECKQDACDMVPVKTDVTTTVHPFPPVQKYVNVSVPNYPVTLHQVDQRHIGVYRCSAIRTSDGKTELVYRIIPFEVSL